MKEILAGYAKRDITPDFPVGISGYGNDTRRLHRAVLDSISGICLALTDKAGETVLLYSVDLLLVDEALTEELRSAVQAATGVPKTHIFLAATHNHSGPATEAELPWGTAYRKLFIQQMVQAGQESMADRASATVYTGTSQATGLCYTRHYVNPDGSFFGDNFGSRQEPIAGHAGQPDQQLRIVSFRREGKRDILLVNWQAHAKMCSTATSQFGKDHHYHLSADFIGYARKTLEEKTGDRVIYFSGASGNLNPDSRIPEEAPPKEPEKVGAMLAEAAGAALAALKPVAVDELFCRWKQVTVPIDHSDDDKIELAKSIWSSWTTDPEGCKQRARAEGFGSAYAARDVIRRYNSEESRKLELGVLRFGQLAFVAVPYEMFCENGVYIKENSPCAATVLMTCVNGYHKYIPSQRAYDHGCYEVDSRLYPRGTAESLAQAVVEMLKESILSD